jgi:hypothetical protein
MTAQLHAGDHITDLATGTDLEIVRISDHVCDGIGRGVIEATDPDGYAWIVIEGISARGGHR